MNRYTDAHCHIITKNDYKNIVGRISNATCEHDWQNLLQLVNQKDIFICLGIHPWFINTAKSGWDTRLAKILQENPKIMVGETGIDKHKPDIKTQEQVFIRHLEIAHEYKRPLHLHCVGAWDKILHIFKTHEKNMPPVIVAHNFNGSQTQITKLADKYNVYFSYSARQLSKPSAKTIANICSTPNTRLLVESDTSDDSMEFQQLDTALRTIIENKGVSTEQINKNFKKVII